MGPLTRTSRLGCTVVRWISDESSPCPMKKLVTPRLLATSNRRCRAGLRRSSPTMITFLSAKARLAPRLTVTKLLPSPPMDEVNSSVRQEPSPRYCRLVRRARNCSATALRLVMRMMLSSSFPWTVRIRPISPRMEALVAVSMSSRRCTVLLSINSRLISSSGTMPPAASAPSQMMARLGFTGLKEVLGESTRRLSVTVEA